VRITNIERKTRVKKERHKHVRVKGGKIFPAYKCMKKRIHDGLLNRSPNWGDDQEVNTKDEIGRRGC